jgi:transcriptional regulator NrdR family protein
MVDGSIRRRRECDSCRHRWTTYEISERVYKRVQRVEQAVAELAEGE